MLLDARDMVAMMAQHNKACGSHTRSKHMRVLRPRSSDEATLQHMSLAPFGRCLAPSIPNLDVTVSPPRPLVTSKVNFCCLRMHSNSPLSPRPKCRCLAPRPSPPNSASTSLRPAVSFRPLLVDPQRRMSTSVLSLTPPASSSREASLWRGSRPRP
jgi:hypothetical protein